MDEAQLEKRRQQDNLKQSGKARFETKKSKETPSTKDNKKKWWKKNKNKDIANTPTVEQIQSDNTGNINDNHESKSNMESCELNEDEKEFKTDDEQPLRR